MEPEALEKEVRAVVEAHRAIRESVGEFVVGNSSLVDLIMIGLLADGHVLIDGVPGTAKTTISKLIARLTGYRFSRVQGAVDVQPADIIGVRIHDAERHEFVLHRGPIFANFVMIDEINRLTPRTQSALLEAMAEHQATIDGITYPIGDPYFALATQNSLEFEGTFPLIEGQRDRFDYSATLGHLDLEHEIEILRRDRAGQLDWDAFDQRISPVLSLERIEAMSRAIRQIFVDDTILEYIGEIIVASRAHSDVQLGASSRGSLALLRGSRVHAALEGRTYVIPDDVKAMALPVLGHRLVLEREAEIGRVSVQQVVDEILETVRVA